MSQPGLGVSPGWSDLPVFPIFGGTSEVAMDNNIDQQQKAIAHLRQKMASTRALNDTSREMIFPAEDPSFQVTTDYLNANPCFAHNNRLGRIHEITEQWRFVGCEVCFVTTGRKEPDHDLKSCDRWPSCGSAKRILRWLESLAISRHFGGRGGCSTCGHGWVVCDEMRLGQRIAESSGMMKLDLLNEYDSVPGSDGLCGNKSVMRRMIAALCASDDHILGQILTTMILEHDGVDITSECQARRWFEGRIKVGDRWVSQLVYVLDLLMVAFKFRKPEQHETKYSIDLKGPARWDNELEVEDWTTALDWLEGKCTFCAGRGLGDTHIRHTLRRCKRGGAKQIHIGIGEMFYDEGFVPSHGCNTCHLPRAFCSRWRRTEEGQWAASGADKCKYNEHLLCDGIIGFAACGAQRYTSDLFDGIEEYREREGDQGLPLYDDETAATWLMQPLDVAGVQASEMVRQLSIWTRELDEFSNASREGEA